MTARMDRSGQIALPAAAMLFACGSVLSSTSLLSPFCVSFALTAVLTILLGRFLAEQGTIRRLLFPRTTAELVGALHWPTLGAKGAVAASKPEPRHHDR